MAIYTYSGNKNSLDGTTRIVVRSDLALYVGEAADITAGELATLNTNYIMTPGASGLVVTPTTNAITNAAFTAHTSDTSIHSVAKERGYASTTTNKATTTTNDAIAGVSITLTSEGRPLMIWLTAFEMHNSNLTALVVAQIQEDINGGGYSDVMRQSSGLTTPASDTLPVCMFVRRTPTLGATVTYRAALSRFVAGTATMTAGATEPIQLWVTQY